MDIAVTPGTYVVAVSGGVDSISLLDLLRQQPGLKLIVAHLDHGIRDDSHQDRRLVQACAERHGLPFVFHEARLGPDASEDTARRARYDFLHQVRQASGARAVITAHHKDDVLETAVHNLLRGTGRKGLSSLGSGQTVIRPLLHLSKPELKHYAQRQGLEWREDPTNSKVTYRRNYIRHKLLPRLDGLQRQALHGHILRIRDLNQEIDGLLAAYLAGSGRVLKRNDFIRLPHGVAREVMAAWLRANGASRFDRKLLEQLVTAAKTLRVGKFMSIDAVRSLSVTKDELALVSKDR